MLIVPEKNVILILPPRTGSSTLHNAIRQVCPASFMLYRHAEADAVPPGFESMRVIGFVRNPVARLWSLFKFLCTLDPLSSATWAQEEVMRLLESVQHKTFEDWLLHNEELFLPRNSGHPGLFQLHYEPENVKSQWTYLRPDLGTRVIPFTMLPDALKEWGLPELHENKTTKRIPMPEVTKAMKRHLEATMEWDLAQGLEEV